MNPKRSHALADGRGGDGPVIYWMSRDQRSRDNWALLHAQELALKRDRPLLVAFCLVDGFLGATLRQYGFMLRGLEELEADLADLNVPLLLLRGDPVEEVPALVREADADTLVTDFDPLRVKAGWRRGVADRVPVPVLEVDAHNVVPCRVASPRQEWAAYTLRPKLRRAMPEYLDEFPDLVEHPTSWSGGGPTGVVAEALMASLPLDEGVPEVDWLLPGEGAALERLSDFVSDGLQGYDGRRNEPSVDGQSNLSPYLHFGQLSAQRVALEVGGAGGEGADAEAFLEELVVRRELSDNFCHYNPSYDRLEGMPDWSRRTLDDHRADEREHLYSLEELDAARTHDELWNAAQREMVKRGKMHGYMRMYWAKKVLEWSPSPEEAMERAIHLNDRYELDGRDPNGYAGIAWSVCGLHDRAWGERPVFGKVRYMSLASTRRKFDSASYISRHS